MTAMNRSFPFCRRSGRARPTLARKALLTALTAFIGGTAHADTYLQTIDQPLEQKSPNRWTQEIWGSPAEAPREGAIYISDAKTGMTTLRTGTDGSGVTFPGACLILRGTKLITKRNFQAAIILEDGGTLHAGDGDDFTGGSLTVPAGHEGVYYIRNQHIELHAAVEGAGLLTVAGRRAGVLELHSAANPFAGTWAITGGVTVKAIGVAGLGQAHIIVGDGSTLVIQYDFNAPHASLTLQHGSLFDLSTGHNHIFGTVKLGDTVLEPGIYDYTNFSRTPELRSYFISGTDTFTVSSGTPQP